MTKKLFLERAKIQGFRVIIILGHLDRWVPSVAQRRDLGKSPSILFCVSHQYLQNKLS